MADDPLTQDMLIENRLKLVPEVPVPEPDHETKRALEKEAHDKAAQTDSWTPENRPKGTIRDLPQEYMRDKDGQRLQNEFEQQLVPKTSPLRHTEYAPPEGFVPLFPQTAAEYSPIKPYTGDV